MKFFAQKCRKIKETCSIFSIEERKPIFISMNMHTLGIDVRCAICTAKRKRWKKLASEELRFAKLPIKCAQKL